MNEEASALVISIAKKFIEYASTAASSWDEAFLRFEGNKEATGLTSIYRVGEKSSYFDYDDELEFDFYSDVEKDFVKLQNLILSDNGKEFCVCLARIDSDYNYKLYYEYEDSKKWFITKMGGESGIPVLD